MVLFTDGYTLNEDRIKDLSRRLIAITDNFWLVGVSAVPPHIDAYLEMFDDPANIFLEQEDPDFRRFRKFYESQLGGCLDF